MERARAQGLLGGGIAKPYEPYPPRKGRDSARYPRIRIVQTSVQSLKVNYFGRYIAEQIEATPAEEIAEAHEGQWPTVLVIGPGQYLRQVRSHLELNGYQCEAPGQGEPIAVRRDEGLAILRDTTSRAVPEEDLADLAHDGGVKAGIRQQIREALEEIGELGRM